MARLVWYRQLDVSPHGAADAVSAPVGWDGPRRVSDEQRHPPGIQVPMAREGGIPYTISDHWNCTSVSNVYLPFSPLWGTPAAPPQRPIAALPGTALHPGSRLRHFGSRPAGCSFVPPRPRPRPRQNAIRFYVVPGLAPSAAPNWAAQNHPARTPGRHAATRAAPAPRRAAPGSQCMSWGFLDFF